MLLYGLSSASSFYYPKKPLSSKNQSQLSEKAVREVCSKTVVKPLLSNQQKKIKNKVAFTSSFDQSDEEQPWSDEEQEHDAEMLAVENLMKSQRKSDPDQNLPSFSKIIDEEGLENVRAQYRKLL